MYEFFHFHIMVAHCLEFIFGENLDFCDEIAQACGSFRVWTAFEFIDVERNEPESMDCWHNKKNKVA